MGIKKPLCYQQCERFYSVANHIKSYSFSPPPTRVNFIRLVTFPIIYRFNHLVETHPAFTEVDVTISQFYMQRHSEPAFMRSIKTSVLHTQ